MMNENRDIFVFENPYKLTDYLVNFWVEYARLIIEKYGRFNVAMCGGRTPVEFYCKLSNIDQFQLWQSTHIFLSDEQFVSLIHEESHSRMIKENLVDYVFMDPQQFHPVKTEFEDNQQAALAYETEIKNHFKNEDYAIPRFDCVFLGLGEDGSVASLYSDVDVANKSGQLVLATDPIHLNCKRISLSLSVINNARKIICLVTGKNKSDIVQQLIEKNADCVAGKLNPVNGQLIFMLDHEAADKISNIEQYANNLEIAESKN